MTGTPHQTTLTDLSELIMCDGATAEVVTWRGHRALKLVDGLAVIRDLEVSDASIEVEIGAEGAAYPGVAFRVSDLSNYELGYAVPHASGLWDAIQYDPVFHGSNTWQLYHGQAYQKEAKVPTGGWFRLRVAFRDDQAAFAVDDQPPLVVGRLARGVRTGPLGIWTFRPAYFRDLRVRGPASLADYTWETPAAAEGVIDEWFLDGFGVVGCEGSGILNLNRFLPTDLEEVQLTRRFEVLSDEPVDVSFGFSDQLTLKLDDQVVFSGENTFVGFRSYEERGYADSGSYSVHQSLTPGTHRLTAVLRVTEGFGWGLIVCLRAGRVRLLPANLG